MTASKVALDISALQARVMSELRAVEQAGGTVDRASHLAFVAHEIRNPMATALWSAELLNRMSSEERSGARGDKLARMCLRAIGRVRRLVEDHLLAERLDVAGIPVSRDAVPVADLVPASAAAVGTRALEVSLEPDLVAFADAQLSRRAVEALVLAAARGSSEAKVRVSGRRVGAFVNLAVEGLPATPEDLADRRRGDNRDLGPASLGLEVARRVATALGGWLAVENSSFVMSLPASEAEPPD